MEARFADDAARLAGLAGALLGWRPDEFWTATPAELASVFGAMVRPGETGVSEADLHRLQQLFPDA